MHCACGCGQETPVAKRNRHDLGHVKGEHVRYIVGHGHTTHGRLVREDRGHLTPCLIWTGHTVKGYGRGSRGGRVGLLHVLAWEAEHGPVPAGRELDHLCRQRECCEHTHLELATHAENCRRGRATKLTIDQAAAIKRSVGFAREIAAAFGVSRSTVQAIRAGRLWADV